jgi:hypothetical protein
MAALYACFGWVAFPSFANSFESRTIVWSIYFSWLHLLVGIDDTTDHSDCAFHLYQCKMMQNPYCPVRKGPLSKRTGNRKIARSNWKTPVTVIPTNRNGSSNSHTIGYSTSANSASGQHSTSNKHHRRKLNISVSYN